VPTRPEAGLRVVMLGAGMVTVKAAALLFWPPTVTITFPLIAPFGTGTVMLDAFQVVGVAAVPLNVTVLVPCVAPKLAPAIVTEVPTAPEVGLRVEMLGAGTVTVKATALLLWPPTVMTTPPLVAPLGTGTTIDDALQLVGVAVVPLNFTVLVPWVAPKFVPAIVIAVPTNPVVGFKLEITGAGTVTVNVPPLICWPPTVRINKPVVAAEGTGTTMLVELQPEGAVVVPLNVTKLVPCVAPKFAPLIVTNVPIGPELGETLVIVGLGVMVNVAVPDFVGSAIEVAVTVTVGGFGTADGAT
jgi:hypothetical protein